MSGVECTPAGLQMIIPGCERRTSPQSVTWVDEAGQGLLGFYRPPSLRERLAVRAEAPLRPTKGQRALPASGLFGQWPALRDGRPVKITHGEYRS